MLMHPLSVLPHALAGRDARAPSSRLSLFALLGLIDHLLDEEVYAVEGDAVLLFEAREDGCGFAVEEVQFSKVERDLCGALLAQRGADAREQFCVRERERASDAQSCARAVRVVNL